MNPSKRDDGSDHLFATVAARQDDALARERVVETTRERLFGGQSLARAPAHARARGLGGRIAWLAAAAVLLGSLALFVRERGPAPALRFDVAGVTGAPGGWIGAPAGSSMPVQFSNGARVVLSPAARARVSSVSAHGAVVEIERGSIHVSVPHEAGTDWRFGAGPYEVKVIGTQFDVGWDADAEAFELSLLQGTVEVRGPHIEGARRVSTGESLRLAADPPAAAPVPDPVPPPDAPPAPEEPARPLGSARRSAAPPPPPPDWASLARSGSYREAFALAETRGFDGEVARARAGDLLLLGDASRYAGSPARARECYVAARGRFPGSPEAARASFRLGVLEFPAPSALPLFEDFLREQPGDPLTSEALGRILEIDDKAGDVDAARAAAQRYLTSYPDGAHARLAHGILGR